MMYLLMAGGEDMHVLLRLGGRSVRGGVGRRCSCAGFSFLDQSPRCVIAGGALNENITSARIVNIGLELFNRHYFTLEG